MDVINGVPALAGNDPMSKTPEYSVTLREALAPVAGRREGLPDGITPLPGGLSRLSLGPFAFQYGVGPSAGGGITTGPRGIYILAAGVRLTDDASAEMQLRIYAIGSGRRGINSIMGTRHINISTGPVLLPAQTDVEVEMYNNGASNGADTFFSELPFLSVYLLHRID